MLNALGEFSVGVLKTTINESPGLGKGLVIGGSVVISTCLIYSVYTLAPKLTNISFGNCSMSFC